MSLLVNLNIHIKGRLVGRAKHLIFKGRSDEMIAEILHFRLVDGTLQTVRVWAFAEGNYSTGQSHSRQGCSKVMEDKSRRRGIINND